MGVMFGSCSVFGICIVSVLHCEGVAVCGSCRVQELHGMRVTGCGNHKVWLIESRARD